MQTAYKDLQSIGRLQAGLIGGFCKWWYTPIQNLDGMPPVDPATQYLLNEPALKGGTTWFGPVNVPDKQVGWEQDMQRTKAGIYYKQKVTGFIAGLDAACDVNLQNLAFHQVCIVGKARSGGNYYLVGDDQAGLDGDFNTSTGTGSYDTPGTKVIFSGESIDRAYVLPSFSGANTSLPPGSTAFVSTSGNISGITYVATGNEGTVINLPALAGRTILLFARENILFNEVYAAPGARDVQRNTAGDQFIFLVALGAGEIIKILYN